MDLGHVFLGEHIKLNHRQLFDVILGIILLKVIAITVRSTWKKVRRVTKRVSSRLQSKISNIFLQHHNSLYNGSFKPRTRVNKERASKKYIVNNGRVARKRGKFVRQRALVMIALTRLCSSTKLGKINRCQSATINPNDDRVQITTDTRSEKDNKARQDIELFAYHATADDVQNEDEELLAFSSKFRKATPTLCHMDTDSFAVGVDSYASRCISPFISDFIKDSLRPLINNKSVKPFGQGSGLNIAMIGTLQWRFQDDEGVTHTFKIKNSLLVPDGSMRLLSPQHFASNCEGNDVTIANTKAIQYWNRNILTWGLEGQYKKTIYNSRTSNVPTFYSAPSTKMFVSYATKISKDKRKDDEFLVYSNEMSDDEVTRDHEKIKDSEDQTNDSDVFHDRLDENIIDILDEKDFEDEIEKITTGERKVEASSEEAEFMRWHYRLGHMHPKKMIRLSCCGLLPRKLSKVSHHPKCSVCQFAKQHRSNHKVKGQNNKIFESQYPGQCVSVDQLESSTEGFYGQMKGRLTRRRYKYATVFVDQFSRFTYIHLQSTLSSAETIEAKENFETRAREAGVEVEHYHADNGRFADNAYRNHCLNKGQSLTFCGVNAHWQNGVAERAIRDIKENSRSILFHAIHKWPGAVSIFLWPYAMRHAVNLRNNTPLKHEELSPIEKFTRSATRPNLKHFHTFGCPVFVLNNNLQAKKPIKTWLPRSRLGIYLGHSEQHARSVSSVLSLTTGLVSAQFHVSHDDFFETVNSGEKNVQQSSWMILAGFKRGQKQQSPQLERDTTLQVEHDNTPQFTQQPVEAINDNLITEPTSINDGEQSREVAIDDNHEDQAPSLVLGRGHRVKKLTQRMQESVEQRRENIVAYSVEDKINYYSRAEMRDYDEQDKMSDPIAFKASTNPDILYYHQAMQAHDKDAFKQAVIEEVNAHIEGNHWELIDKNNVPDGTKVIDSVWAMRRKRDIKTREVYKHKARLNIHGGQQVYGVHYNETYSPVVQWSSVRLALIMSLLQGWATRQIDFVLAFPQADISHDTFIKLPKGIKTIYGDGDTHVLKVKKNLYGGKNAGKVWYEHLKGALENIGFTQSQADGCVFYRKNVIFMFYVDDGLFFAKDQRDIDKAIKDLRNTKKTKRKLTLEDQGDVNDYLGINFERLPDGKLKLTQPQIIDDILRELGIDDKWISKLVPASPTKILSRNINEDSVEPPFDYRKVIGKLNFLEKSTRPDIAYAVHQCARFCADPKQSHIDAVFYLGRYLKGTRHMGLIIDPNKKESFNVWADADFSGNWNKMTAELDSSTAKSRSGYVINMAGCPILWASKLQTQIALSSCESEYICLSQSLREVLPLMTLMQELKDREFIDASTTPKVHCKAFEDNSGCVEMARVHKLRPRTKHINIVYHHFREAVREGRISIQQVRTEEQIADLFTKPLAKNLFQKFRKLLMKW